MKPRAIDLFSGCGGLTTGLKQAGFRVVGAVEIDPLAVETYRLNHRIPTVWKKDIRKLSVAEVMETLGLSVGQLDLLAGCPPCQGFSSMRTLNGGKRITDRRNDLVFEFLRFARVLRPKGVMLENVPGLATNQRLKKLRKELEDLGFQVAVHVLDAADFGVPQRRRRMILLGSRLGSISPATPSATRRTVRDAIADLAPAGTSGDPLHDLPEKRAPRIANLIRGIPADGGSRVDLGEQLQLQCHRDCDGFKDVYGRMAWDKVAPTITSGCVNPSKGRFLHPTEHRTITLREAALLQGFPPKYRFSLRRGKFAVAEMIGNALPPEFIRCHAEQVRMHLTLNEV
jgi:DNA (cytosine-5)-methyltransferase 1